MRPKGVEVSRRSGRLTASSVTIGEPTQMAKDTSKQPDPEPEPSEISSIRLSRALKEKLKERGPVAVSTGTKVWFGHGVPPAWVFEDD